MGRAIKLVLYYFAYQLAFTFLVGLPAGIIKVMNEISEKIGRASCRERVSDLV